MVVKLTELFGTRFFYVSIGLDFDYFMSTYNAIRNGNIPEKYNKDASPAISAAYDSALGGDELIIDLARARITSDITPKILREMRNGVQFCDTDDPARDEILKISYSRIKQYSIVTSSLVMMPTFEVGTSPLEYVTGLQKEVIYDPPEVNIDLYVYIIALTAIYRPSIQFCLDRIGKTLFKYISERMNLDYLSKFDEFYIVTAMGIRTCKKDDIYIQQLGKCTLEEAAAYANVVPTVFGSKVLKNDETFKSIAAECIHVLEQYNSTRPITLREVLTKEVQQT